MCLSRKLGGWAWQEPTVAAVHLWRSLLMVSTSMEHALGLVWQTPVSFVCGSCYCGNMSETGTLHLPQEKANCLPKSGQIPKQAETVSASASGSNDIYHIELVSRGSGREWKHHQYLPGLTPDPPAAAVKPGPDPQFLYLCPPRESKGGKK